MHDKPEVNVHMDSVAKKPFAILDYNATKGAVDAFDELVGNYSCGRKSNRWPMRLFYFMIDTAGVNAYVMFGMTSGVEELFRFETS